MTPETLGFYAVAAVMVVAAVGMVAARNVVHGVLLMIVNFVGTTVLYLWLQAPFIAAVQLIVYAGAIMVLFLFVVMLLGARDLSLSEPLAGQRLWGVALAAVLGGLLVFVVVEGAPAAPPGGPPPAAALPRVAPLAVGGGVDGPAAAAAGGADAGAFGSPQMIGAALFTDHVLPFEVVSVLLLAAMLGAIVIARFRTPARGIGSSDGEGT